jgi:hypothetical protein
MHRRAIERGRESSPVKIATGQRSSRFISGRQRSDLRVNRLAEEKLCGGVEGQAEEERGQINLGCPAGRVNGEVLHHILDVSLFEFKIGDLVARELRAEERTGVFPEVVRRDIWAGAGGCSPAFPVASENAMS